MIFMAIGTIELLLYFDTLFIYVTLRSVTDKKCKEDMYKLEDPSLVASRLPLIYFDQEETLNFSLFDFLLSDFMGEKKHLPKINRLIKQICDNKQYKFLMDYVSAVDSLSNLVKTMGLQWTSFYSDYFSHFRIDNIPSKDKGTQYLFIKRLALELFLQVGEDAKRMSFVDKESKSILVKYISNDDNFLSTSVVNIQEVARGLKQFGVRFVAINTNNANEDLLRLVHGNQFSNLSKK